MLLDLHFAPRKTLKDLMAWLNGITGRGRDLLMALPLNQLCDPEKSLFSSEKLSIWLNLVTPAGRGNFKKGVFCVA